MKRAFASLFGLVLLASPAFSLADSSIPIGQTPSQLLTIVAAIEAQESALQNDQPLACAMLFGAPSVEVGQQVILAWGSVGAAEQTADTLNMRPTNGAVTLAFSTPGTWTYTFKFYRAGGGSVPCTAEIKVD